MGALPLSANCVDSAARKEARVVLRRRLEITPCSDSTRIAAELFDCSTKGVGLILKQPLRCGEQFLLSIKSSTPRVVMYTVRNCTRADPGEFKIGAEFAAYIVAPPATTRETIVDALTKI